MLFSSLVSDSDQYEQYRMSWVFCVAIGDDMMSIIKYHHEWMKSGEDVYCCEFRFIRDLSRFLDIVSYRKIIKVKFLANHIDPIANRKTMFDHGDLTDAYFNCLENRVDELWLVIKEKYFGFKFSYNSMIYSTGFLEIPK